MNSDLAKIIENYAERPSKDEITKQGGFLLVARCQKKNCASI